jgi:hypothetical protein
MPAPRLALAAVLLAAAPGAAAQGAGHQPAATSPGASHADQRRLVWANGDELLGAIGPAVQTTFPDRELSPGGTRRVDKDVALRLNPPPLRRWPFFATAGAAVAAAAAPATFDYLARDAHAALANRSLTKPFSGDKLQDLQKTASQRAGTTNILFVAACRLAVTAGGEALFTGWNGYRVAVKVGRKSARLALRGHF